MKRQKLRADLLSNDTRGFIPMLGVRRIETGAPDFLLQMEEPFLHDEFEGGGIPHMIGSHPVYDATVDRLRFVPGCISSHTDCGNNKAFTPSYLTRQATEERLPGPVVAKNEPYPSPTALAELEVMSQLGQFTFTSDDNAFESAGRDDTVFQRKNDIRTDELLLIHAYTPA
jgi:hypothetical protein